jgi:hypothetical protein
MHFGSRQRLELTSNHLLSWAPSFCSFTTNTTDVPACSLYSKQSQGIVQCAKDTRELSQDFAALGATLPQPPLFDLEYKCVLRQETVENWTYKRRITTSASQINGHYL